MTVICSQEPNWLTDCLWIQTLKDDSHGIQQLIWVGRGSEQSLFVHPIKKQEAAILSMWERHNMPMEACVDVCPILSVLAALCVMTMPVSRMGETEIAQIRKGFDTMISWHSRDTTCSTHLHANTNTHTYTQTRIEAKRFKLAIFDSQVNFATKLFFILGILSTNKWSWIKL